MTDISITVILITVGWAVLFSTTAFLKKNRNLLPESFNPAKFISTIIYAAVVGTILAFRGLTLTPANYEAVAATNAIAAIIIQNAVNTVYRQLTVTDRIKMPDHNTGEKVQEKPAETEKEAK